MKRSVAYAALLALFVATLPAPGAFAASDPPIGSDPSAVVATHGVYLVLMDGQPAVTYDGSIPGLEATTPNAGARIDSRSPAVGAYRAHLEATHLAALAEAGVSPDVLVYDYTFVLDAFAALLTPAEAEAVARAGGVISVSRDDVRHLQADSSPDLLGLTDPRGPWATGYTGEDVVIGVIDTGIWPEHASFADDGDYGPVPAHFSGTACDLGDAVPGASCTNKVLTAKPFGAGLTAGTGKGFAEGEDASARDTNGHGTHVAATAAGNRDVPSAIDGVSWGPASGVAPRARIAAYKACWSIGGRSGQCAVSDVAAAIDQAAADGVDVLNLSIGSGSIGIGVDDVALLFAQASGVVVAAAAGNSGPAPRTVSSVAAVPWVTAVAAATQQREFGGLLTLGDGTVVEGLTVDEGTASLPLRDAASLGNAGCDPALAFAEPVEGAVVVCHGLGASHLASAAVAAAGGAAVILAAQPGEQPFDALDEPIPTIAVDVDAARVIEEYARREAPTASIGSVTSAIGSSSVVAPFSSRGPAALSAELLKPDVTAPGVSILAATVPPDSSSDDAFALMSGTSTASAHVAGVFALVRQAHPDWTPDMVRSAVSTATRRDVWAAGGARPATGFDMGAGFIQPGGAVHRRGSTFNPGLVFEAGLADYVDFLCGVEANLIMRGTACEEPAAPTFALNVPSIAVGDVVAGVTVTRTVTSVADKLRVFEAQIDAPAGFSVEVTPRSLSLAPGESASFSVEITRKRAPAGEWRTGNVTWVSDDYRVAMPVVVRGVDFDVARSIDVSGPSGRAELPLVYGFTGAFSVDATALAPATTVEGTVAQDGEHDITRAAASSSGAESHTIAVPEGAALLRLRLDVSRPGDDLDLYLYGPKGELAARATMQAGSENIDVPLPSAGTYVAVVHGWHVAGGEASYTLTTWVPASEGAAALETAADAAEARQGATGSMSLRWSDLEGDTSYVAVVTLQAESGEPVRTVVFVDAAGPTAPQPEAGANGLETATP